MKIDVDEPHWGGAAPDEPPQPKAKRKSSRQLWKEHDEKRRRQALGLEERSGSGIPRTKENPFGFNLTLSNECKIFAACKELLDDANSYCDKTDGILKWIEDLQPAQGDQKGNPSSVVSRLLTHNPTINIAIGNTREAMPPLRDRVSSNPGYATAAKAVKFEDLSTAASDFSKQQVTPEGPAPGDTKNLSPHRRIRKNKQARRPRFNGVAKGQLKRRVDFHTREIEEKIKGCCNEILRQWPQWTRRDPQLLPDLMHRTCSAITQTIAREVRAEEEARIEAEINPYYLPGVIDLQRDIRDKAIAKSFARDSKSCGAGRTGSAGWNNGRLEV